MTETSTEIFVLTAESYSEGSSSYIRLYGASGNGPVEIISGFKPYFFAEAAASRTILERLGKDVSLEEPAIPSLTGETVKKFIFPSLPAAEKARQILNDSGLKVFESDVRPRERFLMDLGINGGARVEGKCEKRGEILRFRNPKLTPGRISVPLRICSLDIETSISSGSVISIAVHLSGGGGDERRVFIQANLSPAPGEMAVISVSDEKKLLAAFEEWVGPADPDVIIGWNVIGFDLAWLKKRAESLGVPLRLGRDRRQFGVGESVGRFMRAHVPGRVVLDGPQLLRSSFYSYESYSLENVAQQVLGEGKLIGPTGNRAREIERLYKKDPPALAAYNMKDALLVTRIFEKLDLLNLTIRRTELSGMLLDQVGFSTAAFDHFYLPRLHAEGFVAPNVGEAGYVEAAAGGYVMDPVAGLYQDIIGLDFQSLYPSIIRTFNIDPLSRACAGDDGITTPGGLKFSRTRSILPQFISGLMKERRNAKESRNRALSQAIKILMNSFYGVMGSAGCRFYHPALPDAITSTGQWLLIESKRWLEQQGHLVIYGDTDSLFVQLNPAKSVTDFSAAGRELADSVTRHWRELLMQQFKVESHLILEFKTHFKRFLVPAARGSEGGAKKRYAGLVAEGGQDKVEFVGLEVVRSDWTALAREFQRELYTRIFLEKPIDDWIRSLVAEVGAGRCDEKLVYRKRLHKPPDEYGESAPPYVRAARMLSKPGREVRYVMTVNGPEPVEQLSSRPDYKHYIERQLRPVADSILAVLGKSFDRILSAQLELF